MCVYRLINIHTNSDGKKVRPEPLSFRTEGVALSEIDAAVLSTCTSSSNHMVPGVTAHCTQSSLGETTSRAAGVRRLILGHYCSSTIFRCDQHYRC